MDFYAGSCGVKQRLETALQQELKFPVTITKLHFTLWGGLRATGVRIGVPGAAPTDLSSLSVPSVSAKIAFLPLLSRQIVIKKLLFDEPSLLLVEGTDIHAPGSEGVSGTPETETAKVPEKKAEVSGPKKSKRLKVEFRIRVVEIRNATFRF